MSPPTDPAERLAYIVEAITKASLAVGRSSEILVVVGEPLAKAAHELAAKHGVALLVLHEMGDGFYVGEPERPEPSR